MENKVEEWLEKRSQDIKEEWEYDIKYRIKNCESPIEKLFLVELLYQYKWDDYKDCLYLTQYEIKNYRVDFVLFYARLKEWRDGGEDKYPTSHKKRSLIIELDSHLWHGSKPEQFAKEKERERKLQKEGWHIMRFSGREIYRNVEKCVEEALEYISDIQDEILEKEYDEYIKSKGK